MRGRAVLAAAAILFALAAAGCAQTGVRHDAYTYPDAISYVWDDGKDVFLVPRRGTIIGDRVFTENGVVELGEKGSYVYVPGLHRKLVLSDGQSNPLIVNRK